MDTTLLVTIAAVAVVLVISVVVFFALRSRRRSRQQEARREYGPEYERAAKEHGSEREAERELRERRERVEGEVRPLSAESRRRYDERWQEVERTFVDDPERALEDADRVVAEVLDERNFPVDSREEASKGVGVMHPGVVDDFREAQRIYRDSTGSRGGGEESLEKMRQAIRKYRAVYERLTKE